MTREEFEEKGGAIEEFMSDDGEETKYILVDYSKNPEAYTGKSMDWTTDGPIIDDPFDSAEEAINAVEEL